MDSRLIIVELFVLRSIKMCIVCVCVLVTENGPRDNCC